MDKEAIGVGKTLYKIELLLIKVIPYIIACFYFANSVLSYYNIDLPILSLIAGTSILTLLFLYISSFVFRFCIYHRLPIYYVFISDCIAYYDILVGIPINNRSLFSVNIIVFGIFILLLVFFKFKQHERKTSK